MSYARLMYLASLAGGAVGCGTEPVACTDEFVTLTAAILNNTGRELPGFRVRATVLRTGAVIELTAEFPAADLPAEGLPAAPIFSDAAKKAVRRAGDAVTAAVTAGDHLATAGYEFGTDGCHVQKLSGPDTITVE